MQYNHNYCFGFDAKFKYKMLEYLLVSVKKRTGVDYLVD